MSGSGGVCYNTIIITNEEDGCFQKGAFLHSLKSPGGMVPPKLAQPENRQKKDSIPTVLLLSLQAKNKFSGMVEGLVFAPI